QVGKLRHHKEGLLERIFDRGGCCEDLVETFLNELGYLERVEDRTCDADADVAKPSRRIRIGKQVVGQHAVQVEDGVAIKSDLAGLAHQKLDCVLVVKDHL